MDVDDVVELLGAVGRGLELAGDGVAVGAVQERGGVGFGLGVGYPG